MPDRSQPSRTAAEWLANAMLEDAAMQEWFLRALAALPPESRAKIADQIDRHLPAITAATATRARRGDAEAMDLVLDVLSGRTGNARSRDLMLEALGGGADA